MNANQTTEQPTPSALAPAPGSDVASNLAKKTDGIIASAITEALGHNSWQLWAIAHRLRRIRINNQPQETWMLDDKPLLEIWPPEMETKTEGDSIKAVWTVKYRTFGKHQNNPHERTGATTKTL